jgi:hypothetical protein
MLAHFGKRLVDDVADEAAGIVVDGAADLVKASGKFTIGLITGNAEDVGCRRPPGLARLD